MWGHLLWCWDVDHGCICVHLYTCVYVCNTLCNTHATHVHTQKYMYSKQTHKTSPTGGEVVAASAVVLAVGHSARSMYRHLADLGVPMTPKPFAMGFRIEHPQLLLNAIQYGEQDAEGRHGFDGC